MLGYPKYCFFTIIHSIVNENLSSNTMSEKPTKPVSPSKQKLGLGSIVLIVLLIVLPTFFGLLGKPAEMGGLIAACSIALCFANLNRIQSFKGAGFEAQMREAVEAVEVAYATVGKLQELALPVVRANIANITYGRRWDGLGREREHELVSQFTKLAESLEVQNDPEVRKMIKDFYDHQVADHITFIREVMNRAHIQNEEAQRNLAVFLEKADDWVPPPVPAIRISVASLSEGQKIFLEPYILDYEYYVKNNIYRRQEAASYYDLPNFEELVT